MMREGVRELMEVMKMMKMMKRGLEAVRRFILIG